MVIASVAWTASDRSSSRSSSLKPRPSRQTVIRPWVGPPATIDPSATVARCTSCTDASPIPSVASARRSGVVDGALQPGQAPDVDRLLQRVGRRLAGADAATLGVGGVHGGLERQLQQRVAIKPRRERLADSPDRLANPGAFLLELGQPALQLLGHVVELLAEERELVPAGGGDRLGEIAAGQPARRLQELRDLPVQRPRGQQREEEGQDQKTADEHRRQHPIGTDRAAGVGEVGKHGHGDPGVIEADEVLGHDTSGGNMQQVRKGLMTVEQFAEAVGLRPATVRQKVWRREIEFVRIGRAIRFKPETAEKLIDAGTVPAREAQ